MDHERMRDVATETSNDNISSTTITTSSIVLNRQDTLDDPNQIKDPSQRNVATETDFPLITSLSISFTTTDLEGDFSRRSTEEGKKIPKRDILPKTMKPRFLATTSSSSDDPPLPMPSKEFATEEDKKIPKRDILPRTMKPRFLATTSSSSDDSPLPMPSKGFATEEDKKIPKRDILPRTMKPRFLATTSSSSDDSPLPMPSKEFGLKSSKSQHIRKYYSSSEEEEVEAIDSNLQKGNVFVYMVIPPDGGYGWFIMCISFLSQLVVDGIIFGIGVILPHVAQEFRVANSKVVLVASMQVGFYFLAGTVSSAFINKYGFRPVALAGCLLSIMVLTIATFTTNLFTMIIFYSILGGPGLSMVWVSSQLIIGYYFEKYRPIASGLSCSGAGVGIMLFAYMNNVLVAQVGWRNLIRIHVGFLAVVFLMGLTFVEVAPTRIGRVKEVKIWKIFTLKEIMENLVIPPQNTQEDSDSDSGDIITDMTRYSRYSLKIQDQIVALQEEFQSVLEKLDKSPAAPTKRSNNFCCPCLKRYLVRRQELRSQQAATKRYIIRQDLMERQDLFYTGPTEHDYVHHLPDRPKMLSFAEGERRRTITFDAADPKITPRSVVTALSTMNVRPRDQDRRKSYKELKAIKHWPLLAYLRPGNLIHPKIRNGFRLLFDFRLLAIKEFQVLLLSAFLFPMGFNIPFVYSTVRVQIAPSFAKLISPSIGFSNFAFRIASGFIAYKFREHTTFICGVGMAFGGLSVFVSAFYGLDVVWFQFLYAICYGIAPAFYSTLRAIIYVRSLGLDKLTNAFGLTALAMGMGVFIGTTAGGILNDLTGDYTASFAFAGLCIIVAGILKLLLPYLTPPPPVVEKK